MAEGKSYFRYWGKADRTDPTRYHLLPYHCLDVAAVADVWWKSSTAIRNSLITLSGLEVNQVKAWMLFFVALHDYGKFDLRFQCKAEKVWHRVNPETSQLPAKLSQVSIKKYYHGPIGLAWFYQDFKERFQIDDGMFIEVSEAWKAWRSWFAPVAGHHGFVPEELDYEEDMVALPHSVEARNRIQEIIKKDRLSWISKLETLFLKPAGMTLNHNPPLLKYTKNKQSPATMVAGFCSVSDWLGSSNYFPYDHQPTVDLGQWYESRLEHAEIALKSAGKAHPHERPCLHDFCLLWSDRHEGRGICGGQRSGWRRPRAQAYSGRIGGLHHAGAGHAHQPCGGEAGGVYRNAAHLGGRSGGETVLIRPARGCSIR
jgi:CRISPR-associated endonuclease/helicase Cas3